MKMHTPLLAVTCLAGLAFSSATSAQSINGNNGTQVFRLNDAATFQQGCFEPRLCPIQSPLPMRGTMTLGPTLIGDVFNFREITDVVMYVSDMNGNDIHTITGSGSYFVTNFGAPPTHGLSLELQVDGGEVQNFWSDLVPVTSNDGSFDIQVSINGLYCYDTVLQMNASPVPLDKIKRYRLGKDAFYQQGCWDPCDCPLWSPVAMTGGFSLVPLRNFGTYVEYAVVGVEFKVEGFGSGGPNGENLHITGTGLYTLIAGFAGMIESMELDLLFDDDPVPMHFSSGFINSGEEFPEIDIDVNMNGLVCFDIILGIRADVRPRRMKATNAASDVPIQPPATSGR